MDFDYSIIENENVEDKKAQIVEVAPLHKPGARVPTTSRIQSYDVSEESSAGAGVDIREHYNSIRDTCRKKRVNSPIIYVKNLNNWIKAVMIRTYAYPACKVLDIACGKGGDLLKWGKANISKYVGIDISDRAIEDAINRYKGRSSDKPYGMNFNAEFMCYDCCDELPKLSESFDIVSCQFALHYSFESEQRARTILKNISNNLKNNGIFFCTIPDANYIKYKLLSSDDKLSFGNGLYKIKFTTNNINDDFGAEYIFSLHDAIYDCPEYVVKIETLKKLAYDYNLILERCETFDEIYNNNKVKHKDLINKMYLHRDKIPSLQYEVSCLYCAVVFKKCV